MKRFTMLVALTIALPAWADEPYEHLPCNSTAQEVAVIATVHTTLDVLNQRVKSVPPEETKYFEAEYKVMLTNHQRTHAVMSRPLFNAWVVRNKMGPVKANLSAVLQQTEMSNHVLALIDLRDAVGSLYNAVALQGTQSNNAFYVTDDLGLVYARSLVVLENAKESFRDCIGFYMMQLKQPPGRK